MIERTASNPAHKVMVIIDDVTTEKELEAQLKADEERNAAIIKIASDRDGFLEFLQELQQLFQNLYHCFVQPLQQIDPNTLFRYYHTIKGGSASYALKKVVEEAHRVESSLEEVRSGSKALTAVVVDHLREETQRLEQLVSTTLKDFDQPLPTAPISN